jgi:hypothetical protein
MDNSISNSSARPHVAAPIANHDTAPPIQILPEIWCEIAAVSTADSIMVLRQVAHEMREAVDSLEQTYLTLINQHTDSTVELYRSDGGLCSVTKDPQTQLAIARDANISPALQVFFTKQDNVGIRKVLASNPSLIPRAREILAQHRV